MRDRPTERREPAYGLAEVRRAFSEGRFQSTVRVVQHLDRRGWNRSTIASCVASLTLADFHKSQRHLTRTYLVLSFCGDGEEH